MQNSYSDKIVLVTGGTSGIGKTTAIAFADAGAKVIITGRREKEGLEVVAEIKKTGGIAAYIRTDVAKECSYNRTDGRQCRHWLGRRFAEESAQAFTAGRRQSLDREVHLNSMNNVSSAQFGLQVRKQHHRILRTQRISLLSGLIAALAVPAILNAARLSLNPIKIAKDNGAVVLAEQSAKAAPKARVNVDSNGVILKGYDAVAYFTRHGAVKGNPAIQTRFGGATYYFASEADKVAFSKNPSKYVPQYGGFCAYHMSNGKLKDSDPTAFLIYKGKLYVCSGVDTAKKFHSNIDENIRKADDYWLPPGRAEGQPYNRNFPR